MQTIEQFVCEPPTRLTTRGGSWTSDRTQWLLTVGTDRRFSIEEDGTRVDVTVESRLDYPFRRTLHSNRNWLHQGGARSEFEQQLDLIANRIEGVEELDRPHPHIPG